MDTIENDLPFQKLGKYEIISKLGKGAMGMVYKGYDPGIERYVAIKTVGSALLDREDTAAMQSVIARFTKEAQSAGRLNHPNIVSVYEYGEDNNMSYIAMELVEGQELKKKIAEKHNFSNISSIVKMMTQLLDALRHSHENGVIHRDIKLGNIIVTPNGDIKLTDFGVARLDTSDLTQVGTIIGTPSYMSPEMLRGLEIDARTDLFSAGVVFYQLLTGKKPFDGTTITTTMHQILNKEHISPSYLNPHLPKNFDAIIEKALAKDPNQRYQSASDFADDIRKKMTDTDTNHMPLHDKSGTDLSIAMKHRDEQIDKTKIHNPTTLGVYREARYLSEGSGVRKGNGLNIFYVAFLAFLVVVISIVSYFYFIRPLPEKSRHDKQVTVAHPPTPNKKTLLTVEKGLSEPLPSTKADNLKPAQTDIKSLLVLRTRQDREKILTNTFSNLEGKIDISDVRSWLKLTIAFVDKTNDAYDLHAYTKNNIMPLDYISPVTEGPVDIICILTESIKGFELKLQSSFFIFSEDKHSIIKIKKKDRQQFVSDIYHVINKLYCFNAFTILEKISQIPEQSTYQVDIKGNLDDVLFIGNQTDVCMHSNQAAYITMLNINSMNITLLFPNFQSPMNHILKGESLCSGNMDIYPPDGTEMIASFVLKDKTLLSKFNYSISKENPYFSWEYDNGDAIRFCEDLILGLAGVPKDKWAIVNNYILIKKKIDDI